MSFLGDIIGGAASFVPGVGSYLQQGVQAIDGAISGDGEAKPTPYLGKTVPGQTPDHVVTYVLQRMSSTERTQLDQLWYAANPHKPTLPIGNPWDIAHSIAGGNDGRVSSQAGRDLQSFWNSMLAKYPYPAGAVAPTPGTPSHQGEAPLLNGGWTGGAVTTAGGDGSGFPWTALLVAGAAVGLVLYARK